MERALQFEKISNEFFLLVKDYLRRHYKPESSQGYQKYQARELKLMEEFGTLKKEIHAALCDSIDTRTVVEKLRELISLGNAYIVEKEKDNQIPNCLIIRNVAVYITNLLKIFGAIPQSNQDIGYVSEDECVISNFFRIEFISSFRGDEGASTSFNKEAVVMPYLTALAEFREKVRNIAKEHKINGILEVCCLISKYQ